MRLDPIGPIRTSSDPMYWNKILETSKYSRSHVLVSARSLIEEKKIPSDVNIQVLTQSRDELIEKTFESLKGIPRAIVHFYNSTSTLQRKVVFNEDKEGIKDIAVNGAKKIKELAKKIKEME